MKKIFKELNTDIGKWDKTIYLWSVSGKFIGICQNNLNVIMTAVTYRPDIRYISTGIQTAKSEIRQETIYKSPNNLYSIYRPYIYFLPENVKRLYVKDNKLNHEKKSWIIIAILSLYHRIVFDKKTKSFFELYLIPSSCRIELEIPDPFELINVNLGKYCIPIIKITTPVEFPRHLVIGKLEGKWSTKAEMSKKSGWLMSTSTDECTEYFRQECVKYVIQKLEKNNFIFKKTKLYHKIMDERK